MTVPAPRVGPFEVGRQLGRGTLGVVHVGRTAETGGPELALKLLPGGLAVDRGYRAQFAREARMLSSLASPHVLPIRAFGEEGDRLYLASDLVPDGDLERMLRTHGAPPIDLALQLMLHAAHGLADAHAAGLIHGALKPANVMLRREEGGFWACLTDFGTAHGLSHADIPGGARWAAPELHDGGRPNVASDIYSLGCVLWATLVGQPPYEGDTEFQLASAHLNTPPRQLMGGSPLVLQLNAVLRKALAKDPSQRHGSALELRDELRHALSLAGPRGGVICAAPVGNGSSPVSGRPRPLCTVALMAGALVVSAAIGVAATLAVVDFGQVPTPTASVQPGPGLTQAPVLNNEAVAVNSIAEALTTELLVDSDNARCIAGLWVEEMGLDRLVAAGFLTDEMDYRDQDLERVDPGLKESLGEVTRLCLS